MNRNRDLHARTRRRVLFVVTAALARQDCDLYLLTYGSYRAARRAYAGGRYA